MNKFGNLILQTERAIAKVAMENFASFDSAVTYFKKLGLDDDQAKAAAANAGLQDGVLCSKVQEGMPPTNQPQFQKPVVPAEYANPPQPQQDDPTKRMPAPPKEPAQSTPINTQPEAQQQQPTGKPAEPSLAPMPPEQEERLKASAQVMGIDISEELAKKPDAAAEPGAVEKSLAVICKDIWEGDNRGITAFESREDCLNQMIGSEGMPYDEASDICDRLSENSDWDDDDVLKSQTPAERMAFVGGILQKSRTGGGEILRVSREVIAKICPSCGEKMVKNNLSVLKLRLTPADAELRKAIMEVSKAKDAKGHGSEKRGGSEVEDGRPWGNNERTNQELVERMKLNGWNPDEAAKNVKAYTEGGKVPDHIYEEIRTHLKDIYDKRGRTPGREPERVFPDVQHRVVCKSASDIVAEFVAKAKDSKGHGSDRHDSMTTEQLLNHVIANGQKIQDNIGGLGTILPDPKKLAIADAAADEQKAQKLTEAAKELAGLDKRTVGGEVRYYKTPTIYTPAEKRGGVRRWFETRADGDYSIKEPVAKSGTSEGVKLSWETRRSGLQQASENAKAVTDRANDFGTHATSANTKDDCYFAVKAHEQARDANREVQIKALEAIKDAPNKMERSRVEAVATEHEVAARHHSDRVADYSSQMMMAKPATRAGEPTTNGGTMPASAVGTLYDKRATGEDVSQARAALQSKPSVTSDHAKEVAQTILDQLGGRRFGMMTGAKNFSSHPEGALSFRLPGSGGFTKDGINHVKITLTPADTYDIAYGKVRGTTFKVVHESKDIYAEDLQRNFRENTGLETSMGGISKVDQRPTEQERNDLIQEKWNMDIQDTSALANTPDNETFTDITNVGLGKAHDIIADFIAKGGKGSGSWDGPGQPRFASGTGTPIHRMSRHDYLATRVTEGDGMRMRAGQVGSIEGAAKKIVGAKPLAKVDQRPNALKYTTPPESVGKALGLASAVVMVKKGFADHKCEKCGAKTYFNNLKSQYDCPECGTDETENDAEDVEKSGTSEGAKKGWEHRDYYGNYKKITPQDLAAHNACREEPCANQNYNDAKNLGTPEGRAGLKVLNREAGREPNAKIKREHLEEADKESQMYRRVEAEKAAGGVAKASPEAKYTTGGAFNGGTGAEKEASCIPYLVAKGYSEQSAKRICGSISSHVGKNIENEVQTMLNIAKTALLDGSHRVGQPLTEPLGAPGRVGDKPSEQDAMGVAGAGNVGGANVDSETAGKELVCDVCGNSAKLGIDVDTNGTLSGKDVQKCAAVKCVKCGGEMVAKDDDEGGGDEGGEDDVEKTIREFVAKDKDAGGHGSYKRGTELHPDDQKHVLNAYVHRFTKEHKPQWANEPRSDGTAYMPLHASDADWLQNTKFAVNKDGRLNHRVKACESTPTWPDGKDEKPVAKSVGLLGRMSAIVKSGGQL